MSCAFHGTGVTFPLVRGHLVVHGKNFPVHSNAVSLRIATFPKTIHVLSVNIIKRTWQFC